MEKELLTFISTPARQVTQSDNESHVEVIADENKHAKKRSCSWPDN